MITKVDPVKEKQQKNINHLKETLAQQLWNHKQLEMREMPYDSSKVQFHDKLDMFFRMKSVQRPANSKRPKTVKNDKAPVSKMNEYLNQYEKRKEEQNARRFQMLFLKRLESDGCKISISQADRELLRNFGKVEEEKAVVELQKAINADAGVT
jgi:hypothetical protein